MSTEIDELEKRVAILEERISAPRCIAGHDPTEPARDLSAEVERLEAELETTKRLLAESLVERDRLKNLHDARKVRIEGFRDILRERLGDLV